MDAPQFVDPDSLYVRARKMISEKKGLSAEDQAFFLTALDVARHAPVSRPHHPQHVFFTITGQPTKRNKMRAMEYLKQKGHAAQIIDHTPAGLLLEAMSDRLFENGYDEAYAVWHVASARYAAAACGEVHVEWTDVKPYSTSERIEAPVLLANAAVTHINGVDKKAAIAGLLVSDVERRKGVGLRYQLYLQNARADAEQVSLFPAVLSRVMRDYPDVMETANKMADEFGVERPLQYVPRSRPQWQRHFALRP